MPAITFHHFGIACDKIEVDRAEHQQLGFEIEGPVFEDPLQEIRGQFLVREAIRIELLEPLHDNSSLYTFLKRRIKIYHECYLCKNLAATLSELEKRGAKILSPAKPSVAFHGRSIVFVMQPSQLILELVDGLE